MKRSDDSEKVVRQRSCFSAQNCRGKRIIDISDKQFSSNDALKST